MTALHIFDCDGTLLDSMRMWDNISSDYLRSLGIQPPADLAEILDPLTFPESVRYLVNHFDLDDYENTSRGLMDRVLWHYENDLELFPGIQEELETVSRTGADDYPYQFPSEVRGSRTSANRNPALFQSALCIPGTGHLQGRSGNFSGGMPGNERSSGRRAGL